MLVPYAISTTGDGAHLLIIVLLAFIALVVVIGLLRGRV